MERERLRKFQKPEAKHSGFCHKKEEVKKNHREPVDIEYTLNGLVGKPQTTVSGVRDLDFRRLKKFL
jgi:hypothetical protein